MAMTATMSSAAKMDVMMDSMMDGEIMDAMMPVMQPAEIYERIASTMNSHDLAGIMRLFDIDGTTVPYPGQPAVTGMDAVRGVMEQCLAMQPHISYENPSVIVADDIALLRSTWRLNVTGPDDKPIEVKGKGIQVARRQMDGSWRILIDNPWCAE